MNQIARNLHNFRNGFSSDSSDSESDIEDDRTDLKKQKSTASVMSSYSMKKRKSMARRQSEVNELDTAEFDITQWELAIQMHMDKMKGFPKESLWPRDVLFKYYQLMERIQENLQERQEIIRLFSLCMLNDHDI